MEKRQTYSSSLTLRQMRNEILLQAERVVQEVKSLFGERDPFSALAELRFQKIVRDEVFGERMNFEEYLNQTFTYLVCLYAGIELLEKHPGKEITINFGNRPGIDVYTSDQRTAACECFAAVSVKNNDKLKKEAKKLHGDSSFEHKMIFFYTHSPVADQSYMDNISKAFEDISIFSIPFESLTGKVKRAGTVLEEVLRYAWSNYR